MSKVRGRLAAHFTVQFFFLWMFVLVTLIVVLLLVIRFLTNQDLKKTFPVGALDTIITETVENEESVTIPSHWTDQLTERGYWLQVVDAEGKVIGSINAPNRLPALYETAELLQIEENGRFDSFRVGTKFSGAGSKPLLYARDGGPRAREAGSVDSRLWRSGTGPAGCAPGADAAAGVRKRLCADYRRFRRHRAIGRRFSAQGALPAA
ncbi:hypothetical protein [Paenibacillus oleatilyticus]|uniref:hypothetical protein n=1 Tax=Paenibacillus oleatilyticus TaxID=2594886 RepID=UPI0020A72608|nr:hypothetical protein [Paenibacillus oleatilyticus]